LLVPSDSSADSFETQSTATTTRARALLIIAILLLTGTLFFPSLTNQFVDLDDHWFSTHLEFQGSIGSALLQAVGGARGEWLTRFTFALDRLFWWNDPFGYHLTNVLLHMANTLAVFVLALKLFYYRRFTRGNAAPASRLGAAGFASIIFAVHPLRVEPVAWISARSELLATLFFLASVLLYIYALRLNRSDGPKPRWIMLSVCAYGLSLLSGTSGIALPCVLLLLDVYPLGRVTLTSESSLSRESLRLCKEKFPYLLVGMAAIFFMVTSHRGSWVDEMTRLNVVRSIAEFIAAPMFALWRTIAPVALSPVYELRGGLLLIAVVITLAFCGGILFAVPRWPSLAASCVCYLMLFWMVWQNYASGAEILSDRRIYLPSIPWAILLGGALLPFWQAYLDGHLRRALVISGAAMVAAMVVGLATLTVAQTRIWRNSDTLWRSAAAASRSSEAHYKFAVLQEKQGKHDAAIASYRQALAINPQLSDAHERAGLLLQKKGEIRAAVAHFRSAVQYKPGALAAREHLAAGLVNLDQIEEAVQHFRKLVELAPERTEARFKLGTILVLEGRAAEAAEILKTAANLDPADGRISLRLGQVLAAQGRLGEAVSYFRRATELLHGDAEAHESLGSALAELGQKDEAAHHLREALKILRSTPAAR
jgi:tetratricopeptide (TPR) repeat protein